MDFPTKGACTVFTGGCNFRCPFCHNASLVLAPDEVAPYDTEEFFSYINKRKGILDGVCLTGGEPLLQPDIEYFIKRIKDSGLAVKLDTNGSMPKKLRGLIEAGLVDYIAMDIKNSREKYAMTCGIPSFPENVNESVDLIMSSSTPYEFRTTLVRELHTVEDMEDIGKWISGARAYFLQAFTDSGDIISSSPFHAPEESEMEEFLEVVRKYVPSAALRGT